ncbi:hypothetical protein SAMN02745218_01219 [Desulfofundulus australicus DSM 11792]|uniref:TrbC/VIRB2 family protein n=1 Tax=Desulfofundulus australicus DSM 11792 TaxID=1121425 RepID=A0A1M4XYR5_9FIRM|nr:hypothetical protein [Desulfofundulus australicus]SHE98631.1 hypothetical protein SAMN02745218_01219 [Desulfofundulus australicus DSM 11792]
MLKRFVRRITAVISFLTAYLTLAQVALAVENPNIGAGVLTEVNQEAMAEKILNIAIGVGGIAGGIGVLALIYVGFRMVTAASDHTRAEAKQHFLQILIGLGVIGLAVTIVGFIAFLVKGQGQ